MSRGVAERSATSWRARRIGCDVVTLLSALSDDADYAASGLDPPEVEVVIEVPRGSFLKRGSTWHVDFISPLPCPFNYGAVPNFVGM